jgi:uncharacterized protein YcfJ
MHKKTSAELPVRVGIFNHLSAADKAVHALVDAGIDKDAITVICPTCSAEDFSGYKRQEPAGAHTAGAATTGGAIGALLGGLVAVAGITLTGGVGLLVAGSLLGGAAGGAVAGGFVGAMMSRGFEPEIASFYDQAVQKGKILVGVDCHGDGARERLAKAEKILAEKGGETVRLPEG